MQTFKNELVCIGILILTIFSSCTEKNSLSISAENGCDSSSSIPIKKQAADNEKKEIDWASVAIADGGGAALGYELSKYSANPYVIFASMVGIGAYASYSEYERQKKVIDNEQFAELLIDNPGGINPFHPFQPWSSRSLLLNNPNLYVMYEGECKTIGEIHNMMVQRMYDKYSDSEYMFEPSLAFQEILEDSYELFGVTCVDNVDMLFNEEQYAAENGWISYWHHCFPEDPLFVPIFSESPIEEIGAYVEELASEYENSESAYGEILAKCVAYSSRCLWNTIAPDPATIQECMIWSKNNYSISYIVGRECIRERILSLSDDEMVLYPAYGPNNIEALYLYTDEVPNNYETFVPNNIQINGEMNIESPFFDGVYIHVLPGLYEVEHTMCTGVYVIRLNNY